MLKDALDASIEHIRRTLQSGLDGFPELTRDGQWQVVQNGGWVGGHWCGLLWLAWAHSADPALEAAARQWSARLAPRQFDPTTHDLGFLFELSYLLGSRLTGDETLKSPPLQAARTLLERFHERGQFIQAWGPIGAADERGGRAIIDTMMNLYLLYWASQESGEPGFARAATAHAFTVLKYQVRADGSTAHVIDFDPGSGAFRKQDTHQGLSPTSCWSRGQAWAVHGFTDCFRWTGEVRFLEAARRLAEYSLDRLPEDRVPYWDYDSPLIPNDVRDSSAAAILASGLLNLAAVDRDPVRASRWKEQALQLLQSLWQNYTNRSISEPGILLHGTRSKPHGLMDHSLVYGDYYFMEALTRLFAPQKLPL